MHFSHCHLDLVPPAPITNKRGRGQVSIAQSLPFSSQICCTIFAFKPTDGGMAIRIELPSAVPKCTQKGPKSHQTHAGTVVSAPKEEKIFPLLFIYCSSGSLSTLRYAPSEFLFNWEIF